MNDVDLSSNPRDELPLQNASSNLFTGPARQALINEIVSEIRRDRIKEEVSGKLTRKSWLRLVSRFFQHPAVLLLIGFAITGLIGGWLTNRWQRREWDRQQLRLLDIKAIDLKYKLMDDITKSIGERNAAAIGIIIPMLGSVNEQQLLKDEEDPMKDWRKASHDWRVSSQILKLDVGAHIDNPNASAEFERIMADEKEIGGKVTYLTKHLAQYTGVDKDREKLNELDSILDRIEATGQKMKKLVSFIVEETRKDVTQKKP